MGVRVICSVVSSLAVFGVVMRAVTRLGMVDDSVAGVDRRDGKCWRWPRIAYRHNSHTVASHCCLLIPIHFCSFSLVVLLFGVMFWS